MRLVDCASSDALRVIRSRRTRQGRSVADVVAKIIEDVEARGDAALLDNARRFDSPTLKSLAVTVQELAGATVPERFELAIRTSVSRVRAFHEAQLAALTAGWNQIGGYYEWTRPEPNGGWLGQRLRPLASVGIYVPGGKATYPSSVIMNSIPAVAAGVGSVALASPAPADGNLAPSVLVAARKCGITSLFKIGGAAAIAAFAFGTETVPRVDMIAGPGNRYVNEAKRQLWGSVGLDIYAGPSEVCVFVDDTSNPKFAAADLLTQVEHSEDNAGFLVGTSAPMVSQVLDEAESQLKDAPRERLMRAALADFGLAVVARDLPEAAAVVNAIAPEHLSLAVADAEAISPMFVDAGCLLLGEFTPESGGDFVVGPSHTLPTSGGARFSSPLNVIHFLKVQSVSSLKRADLAPLVPAIEAFGEMEGLPAHAAGATLRMCD